MHASPELVDLIILFMTADSDPKRYKARGFGLLLINDIASLISSNCTMGNNGPKISLFMIAESGFIFLITVGEIYLSASLVTPPITTSAPSLIDSINKLLTLP